MDHRARAMAMKFNDILAASYRQRYRQQMQRNHLLKPTSKLAYPNPLTNCNGRPFTTTPLPRLSEGQIPIGKGCHRHTQRDKEDLKNAGANPPPNKLAGNNDCLTDRAGGVFVWSERTLTKLADCSVERISQNQTAQAYLLLV